jgi:hypothetical protein
VKGLPLEPRPLRRPRRLLPNPNETGAESLRLTLAQFISHRAIHFGYYLHRDETGAGSVPRNTVRRDADAPAVTIPVSSAHIPPRNEKPRAEEGGAGASQTQSVDVVNALLCYAVERLQGR